jgi:hypothetical protein
MRAARAQCSARASWIEIGDQLGKVVLIANAGLQGALGEDEEIIRSRVAHGARWAPDHGLRQKTARAFAFGPVGRRSAT